MKKLVVLVGSFFYSGYFPFAPATFASFVWLMAFLFVPYFDWFASPYSLMITLPLSIYTADEMEKMFGHDSPRIVIDEFVGMQFTLMFIQKSFYTAAAGFVLFRFFDILKPFPVGRSQRLHGGLGVVVDDVLAGLYARIVLAAVTGLFFR